MNSNIKLIDFGLAIQLSQSNLAFSALGSPQNMDPLILKKYNNINNKEIGYDYKADIWSLGTICYEMLIGKAVFNAETMNDLITKVENGNYSVPTSVSSEVVSFLNGMLQYKGERRLSADELSRHPFLTKRVNEFTKIDTKRAQRKIDNKGLNINVKKNQTIWSIFNPDSERVLVSIRGGRDMPMPEGPGSEYNPNKRSKTDKNIPRMPYNNQFNNNNSIHKANTNFPNYETKKSFYGQNMNPNMAGFQQQQMQMQQQQMQMQQRQMQMQQQQLQMQQQYQMQQRMAGMRPILGSQPLPGLQMQQQLLGVPGMPYNNFNSVPNFGAPMSNYPIGKLAPSNFPPGYAPNNLPNQYSPFNNLDDDDDIGNNGICSIQ
jgi:serine/threonine-protein kinase ULK/ATG1